MASLRSIPNLPKPSFEGLPTNVLDLWKVTSKLPQGHKIFSLAFAQKAPYFATISPTFTEVRPHYAELKIKKRRKVHNHLGTVHAIALCNGCEAAMGAHWPRRPSRRTSGGSPRAWTSPTPPRPTATSA